MKLPTGKEMHSGKAFRARRGQSMVEFAVVAPLFFLLVFGITDFGLMFFRLETLQYAVREAGRYAVTGQNMQGLSRVDSIKTIIRQKSAGIPIDDSQISITSNGETCAGGPRQMVTVSLSSNYTFITPLIGKFFPNHDGNGMGGQYVFKVSTTFMNEPFSAPNDCP
ncbi:MAG TPA: TadE/TadG family type IV pilus assembly protein [Verrucomicrobiae bacterium]|nr:TadE/TadG family type IV pilus assembly protein [Verrucomicrobiae bacterium]